MGTIIYQNKNTMTKHTEVTQEEFDTMKRFRLQSGFNQEELSTMVNLVRKYINPHVAGCQACNNQMAQTKSLLNEFYMNNKEVMEKRLENERTPLHIEETLQDEKACDEVVQVIKKKGRNNGTK